MRLLHTSDWHLGHTLHAVSRDEEHARFLGWLLDTLAREAVDALVVAGDVFETANPPASAQGAWYGFLAEVRARLPNLDVVVVGGNHDSAARLDAPQPLLDAFRVHVVGGLPRSDGLKVDLQRLVVPLRDARGDVAAWCVAMPYLRVADLPSGGGEGGEDPLIAGVRQVYTLALEAARALRQPGQALVATGHCYMVGGAVSELSERKVLGGNQHALPVDVFPDDVAYVALGHLHLAQRVGGREHVRYSGSPLPLSLDEAAYPHQVLLVELEGERLREVRPLRVPRTVEVLRVPQDGPAPLEAVIAALGALPAAGEVEPGREPFLEVRVALDGPMPGLRRAIEEALVGRAARLVKLSVSYGGDGRTLAEARPAVELGDLAPEDVFRRRYAHLHGEAPPAPELLAAFHELIERVATQGEGGAP